MYAYQCVKCKMRSPSKITAEVDVRVENRVFEAARDYLTRRQYELKLISCHGIMTCRQLVAAVM